MLKVSIITVCYNSAQTIQRTINSVLQQSYENIEYIVVDGASTDGTLDIISEYQERFEGRLKVISEPDEGIYYAMNKGIRMASGELIGILNSDDYYENNAVEHMVDNMTNDKYQILYGFMRSLQNGEEESISRLSHKMLDARMIAHPSCFVSRSIYNDFGSFDVKYVSVADYDFMLRMSRIKEIKFIPVDFLIANFARGGMSSTNKAWIDLLKLRKNYGFISEKDYKKEILKDKMYRFINMIKIK